ncbi:MAG: alkaline phosphatase family protein, partial [Anaerolineales bacterium]
PTLTALMQTGAFSLAAQTTYPAATLPSHASMLTGLCPADHGVDWNDYLPERGYAQGLDLFDLAHAAGLRTVMVVGKEKLRQITEPSSLDEFTFINDRDLVIAAYVAQQVIPPGFGVLFVHFPTADDMGDAYGWMSPEYLSVLRRADQALASLLEALDSAGLRADTLLIVTADHGGHEFGHYTRLPVDMTIPWLVVGPGVRPVELTEPVNVTDTAATAAWALGLPLPPEWDGLPVYEAFGLDSPPRPDPRCP